MVKIKRKIHKQHMVRKAVVMCKTKHLQKMFAV